MEEIKERAGISVRQFLSGVATAYIGSVQTERFIKGVRLSEKLLNKNFYVTDKKGEIKKSYQITKIKVVEGTMPIHLKVKFCEKIFSRKGVTIKNRVRFQDLSVLEKKLGRALY